MPLQKSGVELVAQGQAAFERAMQNADKLIESVGVKASAAAKGFEPLNKAYDAIGRVAEQTAKKVDAANQKIGAGTSRFGQAFQSVKNEVGNIASDIGARLSSVGDTIGGVFESLISGAGKVGGAIGSIFPVIGNVIGAAFEVATQVIQKFITLLGVGLLAAIGLVVGALGGLFLLAKRGGGFEDLISSFEHLTAAVGISASALLKDMRDAVKGLIPDMELLQRTTLALTGLSGEFGHQMGEAIPRLLEISRAASKSTGQEFSYLFESLILGLRRGSPLILDNLGLIINITEANKRYAESIGKSAEQLSIMEQKQALLQAVLVQGQIIIDSVGSDLDTLGDKITRAQTHITNILDTVSLAIQEPFKELFDIINTALGSVQELIANAAVYIAGAGQLIVNALAPIFSQVSSAAEGLNSAEAAKAFARGAANTFGSFARAVAIVGAQILNTVADIAQGIADFLLGHSPPPKGPLSRMEEGARATMEAWLEGFTGVSLEPVAAVAGQVKALLGGVANLTLSQVENRLKQLDRALLPFQQRLDIIKSEFDAISQAGQIAMDAIDRQMNKAVQALLRGDAGSAEIVRNLDARREAIEGMLDAQQQQVDAAQLQLALATAMQAKERTLLNIRKSQLPVLAAVSKSVEKVAAKSAGAGAGGEREKKLKKGAGGGELPPTAEGAGKPLKTEDLFGFSDAEIAGAAASLEEWIGETFGDAGSQLGKAQARLGTAMGELGQGLGNLPRILQEMFDIDPAAQGGIVDKLSTALGDILEEGFNKAFEAVGDKIKENVIQRQPFLAYLLGWIPSLELAYTDLTFNISPEGVVITNSVDVGQGIVDQIQTAIETQSDFSRLAQAVGRRIKQAFKDAARLGSTADGGGGSNFLNDLIMGLSGAGVAEASGLEETGVGSAIANAIMAMVDTEIPDALTNLPAQLETYLVTPFATAISTVASQLDIINGLSPGSQLLALVNSWIPFGLTNLPTTLYTYLTLPFQGALNSVNALITGPVGLNTTLLALPLTTIPTAFLTLPTVLHDSLQVPFDTSLAAISSLVALYFTGEDETFSIPKILSAGLAYFTAFPALLGLALKPTAAFVWENFGLPILKVLNRVIDGFRQTIQNFYDAFIHFLGDIARASTTISTQTGGAFSASIGQALQAAVTDLTNKRQNFTISGISIAAPDLPGAARGGMFGPGFLRTHGSEIVANAAERLMVFPRKFVEAMDIIASTMAQPGVYQMPGGGQNIQNITNNGGDMNNHFYNVAGEADLIQRLALLKAGAR